MGTSSLFVTFACGVLCILVLLVLRFRPGGTSRLPTPPGPRISWFGASFLPKTTPWLTYAQWKNTYGDLVYFTIFGRKILVLNSAKATHDLLDNQSSVFSCRPHFIMSKELMGWDWDITGMRYGKRLQEHRAMFNRHMNAQEVAQFRHMQVKEAYKLLRALSKRTEMTDPSSEIHQSITSNIMQIAYGHEVRDANDYYVSLAEDAILAIGRVVLHGAYMVELVPILKHIPEWMPGAHFKRDAAEWRKATLAMINEPYLMASGTATSCIITKELEARPFSGSGGHHMVDEQVIRNVAGICYAAGVDTTSASIMTFFLAMLLHPEVQRRAQAEIDSVVGRDRIPNFSDRNILPFIDNIIWECARWQPAAPLAMAHLSTEDVVYEGYAISKGTTILPNTWSILHDPDVYPEPSVFKPERYEQQTGAQGLNPIPRQIFGYGRRACPGRWFAFETMWLTFACVLSAYNISKVVNDDGTVMEPEIEYETSVVSRPKAFPCCIKPRSPALLSMLEAMNDDI
ncbi:cytochrome P450 [Stereum hirsutum FP-91666 SS1]|uniref:cytochrome P450 n=1 Tax=Stereum hirsutum (strain FP-91666) TaxID=721885 RepID=UPI000444A4EE|nr:cytochrome P450 [Stereum hirsutum FP-91666 SS1]EIM81798.1 cytochrome P450 [Stereum hirsutum FP-91666 SS1]